MSYDSSPRYPLDRAARQLVSSGLSVLPIKSLEAKRPALDHWKHLMEASASPEEAAHWFVPNGKPASPGLALVCGAVSGGLTCLDFDRLDDGSTVFSAFLDAVDERQPGLIDMLVHVHTRGGGDHLYFRCDVVEGNTKLAMRARSECWVETRGEGGYAITYPTPGYTQVHGDLRHIERISPEDRALLLETARSFNLHIETATPHALRGSEDAIAAFNAQMTPQAMAALLEARSWQVVRDRAGTVHLRRPGKDEGISATIRSGNGFPIFYCFSSNAPDVPVGEGLSPFGLVAHLEHGGDFKATARAVLPRLAPATPAPATRHLAVVAGPDQAEEPRWKPTLVTHAALRAQHFDPLGWVVPGVIPEGCTLFVGGPKTGKSWLALDLAISLEQGQSIFGGEKLAQADVAYLYLEDGERVAQSRCDKLAAEGTEHLHFFFEWRPFDQGGTEALETYLDAHPATRLVIIDTLARVRPLQKTGAGLYNQDYDALKGMTDLSKKRKVSIIIVHHTRKMHSDDAMDLVSGTNGMGGAVDTVMVLQGTRMAGRGKLDVMSRVCEDHSYAVRFDKEGPRWVIEGDADKVADTEQQEAILAVLRDAGCALRPAQIAAAIGHKNLQSLGNILSRMEAGDKVVKVGYGKYMIAQDEEPSAALTLTPNTLTSLDTTGDPPCSHGARVSSVLSVSVSSNSEVTAQTGGDLPSEEDLEARYPAPDKTNWRPITTSGQRQRTSGGGDGVLGRLDGTGEPDIL